MGMGILPVQESTRVMRIVVRFTVVGWLLVLACPTGSLTAAIPAAVIPLARAHAHNDYLHPRPLLDALDAGLTSVEADVWLAEGDLLVAHDRSDARSARTLRTLYLEPLRRIVRERSGRVYSGFPSQPVVR
jgi:hypothetical protein